MAFDKPKVTIDLEEYQELKSKADSQDYRDLKEVVASMIECFDDATRRGIDFSVTLNHKLLKKNLNLSIDDLSRVLNNKQCKVEDIIVKKIESKQTSKGFQTDIG